MYWHLPAPDLECKRFFSDRDETSDLDSMVDFPVSDILLTSTFYLHLR